ncbi:LysR substrate-binding domain-containing protein [Pseudonocardia sp. WMMC193]|uniref:LysR substrate-binding domain-containing protein n=1 Tax=Pseudonocardia sp. WMMC193 TaxID=2911965 RepID=UPI001F2DBC0D|nr:LysR substrate-binding domain-containing protein [Pseudonocardia sp. WMMC193]MCF7547529.1 LysR substrate-binding domain-containing protein [Pseudonocardia sp. WMMC193]
MVTSRKHSPAAATTTRTGRIPGAPGDGSPVAWEEDVGTAHTLAAEQAFEGLTAADLAFPASRLSARRTLRLADLREETLVINVISGTTSPDLWEAGRGPRRSVQVHNVDEWLEAIAAGRGVGLTPASTGRLYRHPQVRYRRIVDAPPVPLLLAWPRTAPHPLAIEFVAIAERRPR